MIHFHAHQIIGKRSMQQDCIAPFHLPHYGQLFVLADGMGGHEAGEVASQTVVQTFLDYFANLIEGELIADALQTALYRANEALYDLTMQHSHWQGMGTTLLAVCVNQDTGQFDYISVGDSPLYHYDVASGSLKRINANHAFLEQLAQMVANGEISQTEAEQHPKRHAITSALTGSTIAQIDQASGSLKHGERLLLASDGIHTIGDGEIQAILDNQWSLADANIALFHAIEACQHQYQDNTSCIWIEYQAKLGVSEPVQAVPSTLIPMLTPISKSDDGLHHQIVNFIKKIFS